MDQLDSKPVTFMYLFDVLLTGECEAQKEMFQFKKRVYLSKGWRIVFGKEYLLIIQILHMLTMMEKKTFNPILQPCNRK